MPSESLEKLRIRVYTCIHPENQWIFMIWYISFSTMICLYTNIYQINLLNPITNKNYFKTILTRHGLEISQKLKLKLMIE